MPSLELLTAIRSQGINNVADVARLLGLDEAEALRQIREAEDAGLLVNERGASVRVPVDYDRGRLRLTAAGHVKKYTLEGERSH